MYQIAGSRIPSGFIVALLFWRVEGAALGIQSCVLHAVTYSTRHFHPARFCHAAGAGKKVHTYLAAKVQALT